MLDLRPIIKDQYTAARVYFLSIVAMLLLESLFQLPQFLIYLRRRGVSHPQTKRSKHSTLVRLVHTLGTSPPFLPSFITTHRLPTLLRLFIFLGLNVLFSWTRLKYTADFKRFGWLCIANGGLALLVSPRGTNLLSLALRVPTHSLLIYHRWCGRATVVHATIHFALNTRLYIRTDQLSTVFAEPRIKVGIAAFAALGIIFLTSVALVRRRVFEVFFYIHFLFIVFVVGSCIHAPHGPEFLLPGLGLWVVDRALRLVSNFRDVGVREVKRYEGGVTKFILEGVEVKSAGLMVWVLFPGVSWNWHPFTIYPNVTSDMDDPGTSAVIAVRGLGGWTKSVQSITGSASDSREMGGKLKIRIDGPYGVGRTTWGSHPVTVLVAGGIGITPGIGIMAQIITNAAPRVARGFLQEWNIHLLWVVKDESHISWFAEELTSLAKKAAKLNVTLDITVHVTGGAPRALPTSRDSYMELVPAPSQGEDQMMTAGQSFWTVVPGRPDLTTWFTGVKAKTPGLGGAVNVCGPRSLVLGTRKAALKVSSKCGLFHVEEEVFEV
ncbi:ferric reductase NAD binding domain-containing protein [Leptodontidium sp. MPI-SDFR-AT-0119]|nr:ferric reductase NAD binding domain-containing protein [Leptodontidium sp. MPI-SDFR-AT-0119]